MRPYINEEVAKEKICPLLQHPENAFIKEGLCHAADCMWWGWEEWPGGTSNKGRCEAPGGAA